MPQGRLLDIVTPLHKRTRRDYLGRMQDEKVHCSEVALGYGEDFWDGDRRYGYGGYRYDGRWRVVAERLVEHYQLPPDARILDVGCGKGFLLHEFTQVLPECCVTGFDTSEYALAHAHENVREKLFVHRAEEAYPFEDDAFDLVLSLTTLHNLGLSGLKTSLGEIERVGKHAYLVVESFRNTQELFNLQCWALTCRSFHQKEEWEWLFGEFGYNGDYEFIYFE